MLAHMSTIDRNELYLGIARISVIRGAEAFPEAEQGADSIIIEVLFGRVAGLLLQELAVDGRVTKAPGQE